MPSLRETQRAIATALFDGDASGIATILVGGQICAADRLAIYRNNLRTGFRKALLLDFPVLARLVGEECFAGLAQSFQDAHPSRNGDLHHAGAQFAGFLEQQYAGTHYAYLADVARLERARSEVLVAPEARGLDLQRLGAVAPAQYASLRFDLDAACRLVRSAYPIVRIWQVNQPESVEDAPIDLGEGRDDVLVCRGHGGVEMHRLTPAEGAFLAALAGGSGLEAALAAAVSHDAAFELETTLQQLTRLQAINLRLPDPKDPS